MIMLLTGSIQLDKPVHFPLFGTSPILDLLDPSYFDYEIMNFILLI